jgi:hypothetical protein
MTGPNVDHLLECLDWIKARHEVWTKRQHGLPGPWTDHPIVASRKFTNVFRILDPGTQFVLSDLACPDPQEFLARVILYRNTNLVAPWEAYPSEISLTTNAGVDDFWRHLKAYRGQVFSGAYMVWGGTEKGVPKIDHVFGWLVELVNKGVLTDFILADSQEERFNILKNCRGIGGFIAMQCLTDFGYGDFDKQDRENDFVVAGPGAAKGAEWLWPGQRAGATIAWLQEAVWSDAECPTVDLLGGVSRKPSLMDIQNCLCETSKLARYLEKPVGRPYVPAHPGVQPKPIFPKHWY